MKSDIIVSKIRHIVLAIMEGGKMAIFE